MIGKSRETASVDFYRDFLWILSSRIRKSPGQTGWEFARAAQTIWSDVGIDTVTDRFYRVRYGGRPLTTDERAEIDVILDRLTSAR